MGYKDIKGNDESSKNKVIKSGRIKDFHFGGTPKENLMNMAKVFRDVLSEYKRNPKLIDFSRQLLRKYNIAAKDEIGEIKALHKFVRDEIRYVKDPRGTEYMLTPDRVLEESSGDCEEKAALLATLLNNVGYDAWIDLIDGRGSGDIDHAIAGVTLKGKDIYLETTLPKPVGWKPPFSTHIRLRPE